jgi:putative nucleotidyltransferase with HDIG domain
MKEDENYSLVILTRVTPNLPLPTDVFLRLDGKFVKYKNKGDIIPPDKFELFLAKGLKNIYVPSEEVMDFLAWISEGESQAEDSFIEKAGEENRQFFQRSNEFKEKIYDVFFEEELDEEKVLLIKENVADFVADVRSNPITAEVVSALMQDNLTVADHSLGVANLSTYLGMALGHGHQFVLENLYLGALFHDYGKARIAPEILENKNSPIYAHAMNKHPLEGVRILQKIEGVPEPVHKIVAQHHEQYNGKGYPKGISGDDFYDLAQVVSMANIFENTLSENKDLPQEKGSYLAIKAIEKGTGFYWNPKIVPRALEALKLAFLPKEQPE